MAVLDDRSDRVTNLVFNATVSSDTTTDCTPIDTADFDNGNTFLIGATAWTDGTYTLNIQESDSVGGTYTDVGADKIIGPGAAVSALTDATATDGTAMESVGVFSNKQFLKAQIVSTATTTGADIVVMVRLSGEYLPVATQ